MSWLCHVAHWCVKQMGNLLLLLLFIDWNSNDFFFNKQNWRQHKRTHRIVLKNEWESRKEWRRSFNTFHVTELTRNEALENSECLSLQLQQQSREKFSETKKNIQKFTRQNWKRQLMHRIWCTSHYRCERYTAVYLAEMCSMHIQTHIANENQFTRSVAKNKEECELSMHFCVTRNW